MTFEHTKRKRKCAECGKPIEDELYYFSKRRHYPTIFIHERCYKKIVPEGEKE